MNKREVDDNNLAAIETPLGTRYVKGDLAINENKMGSYWLIPSNKRTRDVVKYIGYDIHPIIQLQVDCPLKTTLMEN